ncbi:hypothetical protein F5Y18DRAFT_381883, partial [Xylariaceae sp. FL1019]
MLLLRHGPSLSGTSLWYILFEVLHTRIATIGDLPTCGALLRRARPEATCTYRMQYSVQTVRRCVHPYCELQFADTAEYD